MPTRPIGVQTTAQKAWGFTVVGLSLLFAVLLGVLTVFFPWFFHLGLVLALIFPLVVFKAPWVAFALYCIAIFLAPGYKSADALTLVSLGLFALRWLLNGHPTLLPKALARPYVVFLGAVGVAGLLGILIHRYPLPMAYGDGRGFIYWLWLPLLFSLTSSTAEGLRKLTRVMGFVAGVVALVALAQYFTGMQVVAAGRVAGLDAASGAETRVQMHGFLFVSVAAVWALVAMVDSPRRVWWLLPASMVLFAALYANLGRALWFWTATALVLSAVAAGRQRGWRIAMVLASVVGLGLVGLLAFKPSVIENVVERVQSVRDEGGARTSYGWRKLENADALPHILRSPLTGMGLGAEYRRWIHEVAQFEEHTRYVHNSYIFIALKTGLPSLAGLIGVLLIAWWRGWRTTRDMDVQQPALRVAAVAILFPMLGISVTQPELVTPMSALLFSMLATLLATAEGPDGRASATEAGHTNHPANHLEAE